MVDGGVIDNFDKLYTQLCDAHCHPHDDLENLSVIARLKTAHLTVMGVRQDDWGTVSRVCSGENKYKCVPCFGVHPWFTYRVKAPNQSELQGKEAFYDAVLQARIPEEKTEMIKQLPPPVEFDAWYSELREYLRNHRQALVGEVGLDRAARLLPGGAIEWHGVKPTTVQCTVEHQLEILQAQLDLAREFKRAVSIHCVQSQGHLLTLLQRSSNAAAAANKAKAAAAAAEADRVRVCIHSYGGSPGTISQFMQLKGFLVYVSFSVAINGRLKKEKLAQLICSVPEDRLLIESDLNSPLGLDEKMIEIAKIVAEARQWSLEQVAQQTFSNWRTFVGQSDSSSS